MSKVNFVNPRNSVALRLHNDSYVETTTGKVVALVKGGVPRFVVSSEDYASNFGFQWNKWHNVLSESRGSSVRQRELIYSRSGFDKLDVNNKTILECGMGGGDDTEVLLGLPFKEVHSFDISNSVERACRYLKDKRVQLSQASIYEIPYLDESFDFVFCHRVIMHTPDPIKAIECICKKLKPGGYLFIHSYKRSPEHMKEFRYKYRPIVRKMPKWLVYYLINVFAWPMHYLVSLLDRFRLRDLRYQFVPWYRVGKYGEYRDLTSSQRVELEKIITFDALTPMYDNPISTNSLVEALEQNEIEVIKLEDRHVSPVYATGRKKCN